MSADSPSPAAGYAAHYAELGMQMPASMEAFWMPFTANKAFKASPRLLASAAGMYYTDIEGRQILDACAGLWCVNAGHARPRIVEAVRQQIGTLDFAPNFSMSSPLPFVLAQRLEDGAGAVRVAGVGLEPAEQGGEDGRCGGADLVGGGPQLLRDLVGRERAEDVVECGHGSPFAGGGPAPPRVPNLAVGAVRPQGPGRDRCGPVGA